MRAIQIDGHGGPEVLKPVERPRPVPGQNEILVRVEAAGVNRPDVVQRAGGYPPPPGASDLPGLELAGEVVECGPAVSRWRVGDRVCALVAGGGYAEFCRVPEPQALPIPAGLAAFEAASLPETYFTVWGNVFDRGRLAAGESLLVQGGSSGIGVSAIQLAAALGHRVFATAGSPEKCDACRQLGAEFAVNYRTQDFAAAVKSATGGKGVDMILDMVGGGYVAKELRLLADEGRLIFIAALGGNLGEIDIGLIMRKRITITGSTLRPRSIEFKGLLARSLEERVWPLFESRRIRPVVHRRFPLEAAAEAHRLMESSQHIGKIVLDVSTS
jgi:NADPH2:quinone reductase